MGAVTREAADYMEAAQHQLALQDQQMAGDSQTMAALRARMRVCPSFVEKSSLQHPAFWSLAITQGDVMSRRPV